SIKTPAKRKAILASILGLEIYDRLEARAREQAQASRNLADSLNINIANIADLLQSAHEYKDEAVRLSHSLSQIEEQKKIIENRLEEFRQNKAAIESKKEKLSYLKMRIADNQAELQEWEGRLNARLEKLLGYEELLNNSQKIEDNYQIYIKCKEQEQESNLKLQKLLALQERIGEYEKQILRHRQKVQIDLGKINNNISVNEEKHDQLKMLEKEQAELMEDLKCIVESEKELLLKYEHINQLIVTRSDLQAEFSRLQLQIKDNAEKVKLLHSDKSACPLCGTELGVIEVQIIRAQLEEETLHNKDRTAQILKELSALSTRISDKTKEYTAETKDFAQKRDNINRRLAVVQQKLDECNKAGETLLVLKADALRLERKLEGKEFAADDEKSLQLLIRQRDGLNYDKQEHESLKLRIQDLRPYDGLKQQLDLARSMALTEQNFIHEARRMINALKNSIDINSAKRDELQNEISGLDKNMDGFEEIEEDLRAKMAGEKEILSAIAVNRERLDKAAALSAEKLDKENKLNQIRNEEGIYRDLIEVFSKEGVQALLIGQAFPEIEMEANRLLSKMSDNRLSLKLEGQKELKSRKGESVETLDIKISDEYGTRDYEMFSGGETFRIDLALRIALSKLLVRRAGAALPILIIDEGFGTQDSVGRERLVEAIKSIEDDFEKIFVITHLEDLKDNFPTIINVTKTGEGATISMN
ncbi:MAG TPA: SMC family ATPase, partial [Dehalococcoidia bacterium]|nr:SMC family ATPase [Dehalococcoidia bacterium]